MLSREVMESLIDELHKASNFIGQIGSAADGRRVSMPARQALLMATLLGRAAMALSSTENEALRKDAERFRWLLAGNGYFMEHEMLCGHKPCDEKEQETARRVIDEAMNELPAVQGNRQ